MAAKDFKTLFESDSFVSQYKTGEKITGAFARTLIGQSGILTESKTKSQPDRPLVVLDNACGTGVVSSILHHGLDEQVRKQWTLTCGDISEGMLKYTRARVEEEGWLNVEVKRVDAQETGLPSERFSYMFTAFGTLDILLQELGLIFF
jgi:SAM-dependent methyltransferase